MAASRVTVFGELDIRISGTPIVSVGAYITRSGGLILILKAFSIILLTRVLLSGIMVALRALVSK